MTAPFLSSVFISLLHLFIVHGALDCNYIVIYRLDCQRTSTDTHSSNHTEQVWVWENEGADALYFDNHESVRFRIEAEEWTDHSPLTPSEREEGVVRDSPYRLQASMAEPGLGPCLWWDGDDEEEEYQDGEGEEVAA